jgi:hypothetical protein
MEGCGNWYFNIRRVIVLHSRNSRVAADPMQAAMAGMKAAKQRDHQ